MQEIEFSLDQITEVSERILTHSNSKVLCFYGPMGSGKTTLIKALVQQLGAGQAANSPTFGIVNEYHKENGELLAYHFDFYRLEEETEALDLGFEDYLNQDVWIFIEWPEKISSFLPEAPTELRLAIKSDTIRCIKLE